MDAENIEQPTWLRIMQNGTLGEARTKAFLLERFWILERSVDIEGADFLIQPRILKKDLFKTSPQKFGIVQVKYYESETTTQYIPVDYFLSDNDEPRKDFFVIVNTGKEDDSKMYFLTSEDIHNNFQIIIKKNKKIAKLYGKEVLIDRFLIKSKKQCLNRIEHIMHQSSFENNRKFLSKFISFPEYSIEAIDVEYKESIPNWYGDIPMNICELKGKLETITSYFDDVYSVVHKIILEQNPLTVMDLIEDYKEKFEEVESKNNKFLSEYYDSGFSSAIEYHDKIYKLLKRDGLLDCIEMNRTKLFETFSNFISEETWIYNTALELHIYLCGNKFEIDKIFCKQKELSNEQINKLSIGHFYKNVKWISDVEFLCLCPTNGRDFNNEISRKNFINYLDRHIFDEIIDKTYGKESGYE